MRSGINSTRTDTPVERDDGEDVLVKKRHGEADLGLRVIRSTVSAVRIRVQKE